jgi:hypothetical protein
MLQTSRSLLRQLAEGLGKAGLFHFEIANTVVDREQAADDALGIGDRHLQPIDRPYG